MQNIFRLIASLHPKKSAIFTYNNDCKTLLQCKGFAEDCRGFSGRCRCWQTSPLYMIFPQLDPFLRQGNKIRDVRKW